MRNAGRDHREQIGPAAAGRTALDWLVRGGRLSAEDAERLWRARFAAGEVLLDGAVAAPQALLRLGQWLTWRQPPWVEPEAPLDFRVLHLDQQLLAVDKPSGLPTLPGAGYQQHTLLVQVRARFPEAAPLHRLGRHTSGLVLFARTIAARGPAASALHQRGVRKLYRALAEGTPGWDTLPIDAPIGEIDYAPLGRLHAASESGKPSRSVARVLERRAGATLLEVEIATGRPHQIRIHLAWAGHPLVGDPLYGPGGVPRQGTSAVPGDGGYLLHAARLCLRHPSSGAELDLRSAPPESLSCKGE